MIQSVRYSTKQNPYRDVPWLCSFQGGYVFCFVLTLSIDTSKFSPAQTPESHKKGPRILTAVAETGNLNFPKTPWDVMGCQNHLFGGPETGCHERRVWCFLPGGVGSLRVKQS